jgi:RNA polymerase sigma factor (sigma-70 family)
MTAGRGDVASKPCPDFARAVREATADESLFAQVVACFAKRLESFAAFTCRDPALGADAFQDAMVAALDNLSSYRGDAPIEPWLRRIVVSACSRIKRGRKNSPAFNVPLEDDAPAAASAADQELKAMMFEGLERLGREIDALEEPNRSLLLAHDVDEVSIEQLAARFAMTPEAVKSRLKRARAMVRDKVLADA